MKPNNPRVKEQVPNGIAVLTEMIKEKETSTDDTASYDKHTDTGGVCYSKHYDDWDKA